MHFTLGNQGTVKHEIVFGDQERQDEREKEMASGEAWEMAEPGKAELDPSQTRTLDYTFPNQPGMLLYSCHEPGHWAAGIKGTVTIQ